MRDDLRPLGLERLLRWIRDERDASRTIFGLAEELQVLDLRRRPFATRRHGHALEAPIGVAAGPHTQLSQNLVAAWLCGARFLELKTVQVLDELSIPRPCIDMADEGYNCEWSQELPIDRSFSEYADAWVAIRLLQLEAGAFDPGAPGFVFNLSVGYDLEGIRGAKVGRFLDRVADAREELQTRLRLAQRFLPHAREIEAPRELSDNVTLSTMHGCPAEEIESIGRFLLEERGLHTTIKLNPTLLGARELRGLLHDELGWEIDVPDEAFAHDPTFEDAVDLLGSLSDVAARRGLDFGVKLTNTLECLNRRHVLPEDASTLYLSGRVLHPITVRLARRLQDAFSGRLDVSFSGGADHANTPDLLRCGLGPVTTCSDLLRPGGTLRLRQYLEGLEEEMRRVGARDLDEFVRRSAGVDHDDDLAEAAWGNLRRYDASLREKRRYHRGAYRERSTRTARALELFDCVRAPCVESCPTDQDVPEYLRRTARGDLRGALEVVLRDNPFPNVTGMACDQPCRTRCTRVHYEDVVGIRDVKRVLAHRGGIIPPPAPAPPSGRRVHLVGAGPASLSCAYALALAGVEAVVHEAADHPGGMVTGAIPVFRLADEDFERDLDRIRAAGVEIRCGERIDAEAFRRLREEADAVFVGVGAQVDRALGIPGEEHPAVLPALPFLAAARRGRAPALTGDVAVIGGGDSAMDAARTAVRLGSDVGRVHVVYRRTLLEMPADGDEVEAVRSEGIHIHERLSPLEIRPRDEGLELRCAVMEMGAPDESGRARPTPIPGREHTLTVDSIIVAVGQRVDCDWLDDPVPRGVHVGGDARRGPSTLVHAIADGRQAAARILEELGLPAPLPVVSAAEALDEARWQERSARMVAPQRPTLHHPHEGGDFGIVIGELTEEEAREEAARCLDCDRICDVCVSVCPNRANFAYRVRPTRRPRLRLRADGSVVHDGVFAVEQPRQTAHVADFCNHCGNCTTFCPTSGEPFLDKPRFALDEEGFLAEDDIHLLERGSEGLRIRYRRDGREEVLTRGARSLQYVDSRVRVELDPDGEKVREAELLGNDGEGADLGRIPELLFLLEHLGDGPLLVDGEG